MTKTKIEDKIAKLLRLAASSNVNEAANAFAQAQRLAMEHALDLDAIATGDDGEAPDAPRRVEPVGTITVTTWGRAIAWKMAIMPGLCKANRCGWYYSSGSRWAKGGLHVFGQPSDTATVRYLFGLIVREIDRLGSIAAQGKGRTYGRNFRIGAAHEVSKRLQDAALLAIEDARIEAREKDEGPTGAGPINGHPRALVKLDKALDHFKAVESAVSRHREGLGLRRGSTTGASSFGYGEGREAGAGVSLGGGGSALGSGAKALK